MESNFTSQINYTQDQLFAECANALAFRLCLSQTQSYVYAILIALVAVPTILSNGLLLIGIKRTKQPQSCGNFYIIISAIFGCLNAMFGMPMYALLFSLYHKERNCLFEKLALLVVVSNAQGIGYTIFVLAIDRYVCVSPNFVRRHSLAKMLQSKITSYVLVITITILSILHGLMSVQFFGNIKNRYGKIVMSTINVLVAAGIYIAYLKLYREIRQHESSLRRVMQSADSARPKIKFRGARTPRYILELIKTISVILVAGVICYVPFIAMDFWTGWYTIIKKTVAPQGVRFGYYLSTIPVFLNSSVNAVLFLYRNRKAFSYIKQRLFSRNKQHNIEECIMMKQFGPHGTLKRMTAHSNENSMNDSIYSMSSPSPRIRSSPLIKRSVYVIHCAEPHPLEQLQGSPLVR